MFFERAYGLNGQKKVDHVTLKQEMMALTGCSERAVQAVLYGSSYNELLGKLRAQVPGYVPQKAADGQDFSRLPYYNFDGNTFAVAAPVIEPSKEFSVESTPARPTVESTPAPEQSAPVSEKSAPVTAPPAAHGLPVKHYPTVILLALAAVLPLTTFLY
jgi:hypothetical protein